MDQSDNTLLIPFGHGSVQAEKVLRIYLDAGFEAKLYEDAGEMFLRVRYPMHRVMEAIELDRGGELL